MTTHIRPLLVELLTEELPPKALQKLGQAFAEIRCIGQQDLGDACDLGRCFSSAAGVAASNQDVDVAAALCGSGDGVQGASLERSVVVFGDDKCGHDVFLF